MAICKVIIRLTLTSFLLTRMIEVAVIIMVDTKSDSIFTPKEIPDGQPQLQYAYTCAISKQQIGQMRSSLGHQYIEMVLRRYLIS